jgi:phenylalanyl-tRNA synthetase beta chain
LCSQVEVFDVYEGDKLAHGQKSVAFRLSYQDKNATLQDSVVNDSVAQVLTALQTKYSITVR